ncbi:MAG: branched-chain amino acid ABC transporter permease [Agarilytica sp.]
MKKIAPANDLLAPIAESWWTHKDATSWLLIPGIAALFLGFLPDVSGWLTLTIAGIAMGMMLFIVTAGFTLVFGLMRVLNFGHSVFITLGAYSSHVVVKHNIPALFADSFLTNLLLLVSATIFAMLLVSLVAVAFERILIRKVYNNELMQILMTIGGLIVVEQAMFMIWGVETVIVPKPTTFQGAWNSGNFVFEKYRLFAVIMGLILYSALLVIFRRTKLGLVIRAGVENREMVEAFGYNIKLLFTVVFVCGAALAAFGGVLWSFYEEEVSSNLGHSMTVSVFVVAICGGLGSITGCFVAAILLGLLSNYVGYVAADLAHYTTILFMIAILVWRPNGLIPLNE